MDTPVDLYVASKDNVPATRWSPYTSDLLRAMPGHWQLTELAGAYVNGNGRCLNVSSERRDASDRPRYRRAGPWARRIIQASRQYRVGLEMRSTSCASR